MFLQETDPTVSGNEQVRIRFTIAAGSRGRLQDDRFPTAHPLLECRGVEFEEVEKIAIEADGQIVIVVNLAGMTELNLVDDSSKMGYCLPAGLSDSSGTACLWCGLPNRSCTSSRKDSIVLRIATSDSWFEFE